MGERPKYPQFLFSASLRFTPSGLTRIFVPDEYFVTENDYAPQNREHLSSRSQLLATTARDGGSAGNAGAITGRLPKADRLLANNYTKTLKQEKSQWNSEKPSAAAGPFVS